jgi:uncharacterized protein (DUF1800 family)
MNATSPWVHVSLFFLAQLSVNAADHTPAPDIWTFRYNAAQLDPSVDTDSDGYPNGAESEAGTDPFDAASAPRVAVTGISDSKVFFKIVSQPAKFYQLFVSPSPGGPWSKLGKKIEADADLLSLSAPVSNTQGFFRVEFSDDDSDRDGLSNWAESQLAGFDPHDDDSFGTGKRNGDLTLASAMATALGSGKIQLTSITPNAYEKEQIPAAITFTRSSDTTYPLSLFLYKGGLDGLAYSAASPADYLLTDTSHTPVSSRIVIPAGKSSITLQVWPTADTQREVPKCLQLAVGGSTACATVTIRDAVATSTDPLLFVAELRPRFGNGSSGWGLATLRLPADNDTATVSLSFSNLSSPVQAVQIESRDDICLKEIAAANYQGQDWPIRACGSFPTDQALLESLLASGISVSIKSESHPSGEIEGIFHISDGFFPFSPPPAPPLVAPLEGSELDRDIVRFLDQATFGPTSSEITNLRSKVAQHSGDRIAAFGEWINEQFSLQSPSLFAYLNAADRQEIEVRATLPSSHPDYTASFEPEASNRIRGWWLFARHAPDQLRQRAAFALGEIFVISEKDPRVYWLPQGTASYHDLLCNGCSGNYRELIEQVARHPIMGLYLSHLRNSKTVRDSRGNVVAFPDENFARELMQLFSIGLVELNPDGTVKSGPDGQAIPTYHQEDVAEMARVFTGWSFSVINSPADSDQVVTNTNFFQGSGLIRHEAQWTHPMAMFPAHHDTGPKSVLGLALPAGQSGEQDLASVLDCLAAHPNTAPFICRRLIQRLVTANPSPAYVYRTSCVFTASGGNFPATIKSILLDPEARNPAHALANPGFGKKREPLLRHLAFLRACNGKTRLPLSDLVEFGYPLEELSKFPTGTTLMRYWNTDSGLSQSPQSAPSVFNWFSPDYVPAGILAANNLTSPELKLTNENSYVQEINLNRDGIFWSIATARLPGQDLLLPNPHEAENLNIDFGPFEARYLAMVDTNGDGSFTAEDTETFNQPSAISAACEAVVDQIDLLLCAGDLKARYGSIPDLPRRIIIDTVAAIGSDGDPVDDGQFQAFRMRYRICNALWLVMSSADAAIQK